MLKSSIKFNEAFEKNERKIYARITINDQSFTEADIFNIKFESGSINGPGYQIGSVFSDYVSITLDKVIRGINELDQVIVELGIEREQKTGSEARKYVNKTNKMRTGGYLNKIFYENPIEYVRLGTFFVSEHVDVDENEKTTTINCMDSVLFLEGTYKPTVTFPAKLFDVAADACYQAGVAMDVETFLQLPDKKITTKPTDLTIRQVLGYISQYVAGYIKFSKYDVLQLKNGSDTVKIINTDLYYSKGLSKNDLKYKISGLTNSPAGDSASITVGSTTGNQLEIDNPFVSKADLQDIFSLLSSIEYYPFNIEWRGIPSIEAGDWMIVEDIEGNQYKIPNLKYTLSYNGGLRATSSAEAEAVASATAAYKSKADSGVKAVAAQVASVKNEMIDKEKIIEQINLSEEKDPENNTLRITPNKIRISMNTEIDDNSIEGEKIKEVKADKLVGEYSGDELKISFDEQSVETRINDKNKVMLSNGMISLQNAGQIVSNISVDQIRNPIIFDGDIAIQAIKNTDVVSFEYLVNGDSGLGILLSNEFIADSSIINLDGTVSESKLIYLLFSAIKNLETRISELEGVNV
nr:MAG TPA: Minor structural protein [Caudoviricetes sp.]